MDLDCDNEWENFCLDSNNYVNKTVENCDIETTNIPKCSDIYISTKTMIGYLNTKIDINTVFWMLNVMEYGSPKEGIIKKQIKMNFANNEEIESYKNKIKNEIVVQEIIISKVETNKKFKDIRKLSIGISKKDILSNRCKKKSAFYNCFVLILRVKFNNTFKEAHVKVFNTGKIEIPGIQSDAFLKVVLEQLVICLNNNCNLDVNYDISKCETVLINSNFNCGFYLDREKFYDILKTKYNLHCSFDPCSYPGIMCKFYYNLDKPKKQQFGINTGENNTFISVSFMIFRTGSVLIVGRCTESILFDIYEFLKNVISNEYNNICKHAIDYSLNKAIKSRKIKKKKIIIHQ